MKEKEKWIEKLTVDRIEKIIKWSLFLFSVTGIALFFVPENKILGLIFLSIATIGLVFILKNVLAEPPHLALVTLRGERIKKVKKEGLRLFADFFPFFYGAILINVEKKNQDLPSETVRTPDLAELEIPISLTWTPGTNKRETGPESETDEEYNERLGEFLINYLNNGGEGKDNGNEKGGVRSILADIVRERVREWAIAEEEGPKVFEEALKAQDQAVAILLKTIAGEELEIIPSVAPTTILFKYFNEPKGRLTPSEKNFAGENWENIEAILKEEDIDKVRESIKNRKIIVKKIKSGNGTQPIKALGITLNRLNIGDIRIKPGTDLAKAAEQKAREDRDRIAEELELRYFRERVKELIDPPFNFSKEQAMDIVQTERKKVVKEIKDIQGFEKIGVEVAKVLGTLVSKGGG